MKSGVERAFKGVLVKSGVESAFKGCFSEEWGRKSF